MADTATASELVFATGCKFIRDNDGKFSVEWVNGTAVDAVRGAAVDYIEPKYHAAVTVNENVLTYAPAADLGRLVGAGVAFPMAMVIVGMRRICASFRTSQLNLAEIEVVEEDTCAETIDEKAWTELTEASVAYHALIDMGPTILGMNGLSLMQKGHNYLDGDSMWERLNAAGDLETSFGKLGIADFGGVYYHDALHPFSAEWKVRLASDVDSPLVKHCNGVLLKRLPGVPSGTTLVFVTLAAINELSFARAQVSGALAALKAPLEALTRRIRAAPLDHCSAFPRAMTRENLEHVAKVEPIAAFIYGASTAVFDRKTTLLKSMAFKSNAGKLPGMTSLGRGWGESLEAPEMDAAEIERLFRSFIDSISNLGAPAVSPEDAAVVHQESVVAEALPVEAPEDDPAEDNDEEGSASDDGSDGGDDDAE